MTDEDQPVQNSEFVLRRIHRNHYREDLPTPVQAIAFRPNPNDTTGLSVFREMLVQAAATLANITPEKQKEYYVVRDLEPLGLTLAPEPDDNGPQGHAVIPELSWQNYQADKKRLKQVQLELAKLASANIVHSPG